MNEGILTENLQTPAIDWTKVTSGTHEIPLELIRATHLQSRTIFDEAETAELADSIEKNGQIQAAVVRPIPWEKGPAVFEFIVGERRSRALKLLGRATIRAEVRSVDSEAHAHRIGLVENVDRKDLSALEKASSFAREMELGGYSSVKEMAAALGMESKTETIRDYMGLLKLIPDAAEALREGEISYSHAVLISGEKPSDQQRALMACFETETVTYGSLPETSSRLISQKALRSWIQTHLREPADDADHAKKVAEKRVEAEKRSDGERAIEREGARLAGEDDAGKQPLAEAQRTAETRENGEVNSGPVNMQPLPEAAENTGSNGPLPVAPKEDKAAVDACDGNAREIVNHLVKILERNFKNDWLPGCRIDHFIEKLLNELLFERQERALRLEDFKAAVNGPKKKKAKSAKTYSEGELDVMIRAGATYIVDAMEIDDVDLLSMQETGMSDQSISNLLEAHFDSDEDKETFRELEDCFLTFGRKSMSIWDALEEKVITSISDAFYVKAIRLALNVPDVVDMAEMGAPKEKKKKKPAVKKSAKSKAK